MYRIAENSQKAALDLLEAEELSFLSFGLFCWIEKKGTVKYSVIFRTGNDDMLPLFDAIDELMQFGLIESLDEEFKENMEKTA